MSRGFWASYTNGFGTRKLHLADKKTRAALFFLPMVRKVGREARLGHKFCKQNNFQEPCTSALPSPYPTSHDRALKRAAPVLDFFLILLFKHITGKRERC